MGTIEAVAADGVGNFYVADSFANLVFKISAAGIATVVAGNGSAGYSGDGGPASSAQLNNPKGLAVDAQGNLFISDSTNRRIRKVSGAGVITTIAGNGTPGYSGDGGPAAQAQIDSPAGLAFDAIGDLFITDIDNSVIRKVSTAGTISTFAGNGTVGYSGDGGLATEATFREPYGVAVDVGGNVYIADTFNSVIRKVTPGGIISTFAGNGTYGFSGDGGPALGAEITYPFGISVDAVSNLYIADSSSARVRKVTPTGIITTVAGDGDYGYAGDGGAANSAELEHPTVLAIGTNGTLFIGDVGNDNVRQVSSSQIITTAAGNGSLNYAGDNGPAARALLAIPSGLALLGDGSIVASDSGNNRVREISASGVITTIAGNGYAGYTGDNSLATEAEFDFPVGVAADASGNIYVADVNNAVVRKIGVNGVITTFAGTGQSGSAAGDGGQAVFATLSGPVGVAVDNTGAVYIADTGNCDIRKVSLSGVITTVAGDSNCGYFGDNGSAVLAELNEPQSLAFDVAGDLYIADAANYVIRKVDTNGIITTVAGNGTFGDPGDYGPATSAQLGYVDGIAIDEAGNLYISNEGFPSLRKVAASGIITTIAGGVPGYSGDRGPAIGAALSNAASQIALGPNGTIYFADTDNNAIRTLTVCIQSLASTAGADSTAQTLSIPLSATSACSWSASNLPSWITAASSGTGSGTLALTLQANTTGGDRSATISVNGLNIAVTQDFTVEQFKGCRTERVLLRRSQSAES
jgi:sugar lactone lactonase YvrE